MLVSIVSMSTVLMSLLFKDSAYASVYRHLVYSTDVLTIQGL